MLLSKSIAASKVGCYGSPGKRSRTPLHTGNAIVSTRQMLPLRARIYLKRASWLYISCKYT